MSLSSHMYLITAEAQAIPCEQEVTELSLRRQEAVPLHLSIFICILRLRTYKNPATFLLMHTGGVFSFQGILQCRQQCHTRHIPNQTLLRWLSSAPQHSKDSRSPTSYQLPGNYLYVLYVNTCVHRQIYGPPCGWDIYFVNRSTSPDRRAHRRPLPGALQTGVVFILLINGYLLHCNIKLGSIFFSEKKVAFIFSHCLIGFRREQFYYKYYMDLFTKSPGERHFTVILKGHLLILFILSSVYK